jgi:ATP-dependent Lhr-like helicase
MAARTKKRNNTLSSQTEAQASVRQWFKARGWEPLPFQRAAWKAYRDGRSGLIHAPTGVGKTYAAALGPVLSWLATNDYEPGEQHPPPLHILWVTPLRALASDLQSALQDLVTGLNLPWTVAGRTGDTPAGEKKRQRTQLPTVLVTTPESLNLLFTYEGARKRFGNLHLAVVDEWHELMGAKRGVLVELALARLRAWQRHVRIWGLSATLGNADTALRVLLGQTADKGVLIRGPKAKTIRITSLRPDVVERFPWAGHLGLNLLPQVMTTGATRVGGAFSAASRVYRSP